MTHGNSAAVENCALKPRQYAFAFLSLLISLILIYYNSFKVGWHYDDGVNIVDNPNIRLKVLNWSGIYKAMSGISPGSAELDTRALSYLTFALNHFFGKFDVFGYHLVNFSIHYSTAIFLFLFIYKTLRLPIHGAIYLKNEYSIALLATFFWASHPIQVTAVTYIVQRMTSMAALFYVAAMYFYLQARIPSAMNHQTKWYILCALSGPLAMASKENAVMLPISLIFYDIILLKNTRRVHSSHFTPWLATALAVIGVTVFLFFNWNWLIQGYQDRPFTLMERLMTQPRVILFYISLLLYPLTGRFSLIHDIELSHTLWQPWSTLPALIVCFGLIYLALWLCRKKALPGYCLLFFFLNHLIEGSIIPLDLAYEHRNYLPSILFFIPLVLFFIKSLQYFQYSQGMRYFLCAGVVALLICQAHTVYLRNRLFLNETDLWQDIVKKAPQLSISHLNLGKCYWNRGFFQKAMNEYQTAASLNRFLHNEQIGMLYYNMGLYHAYYQQDFKVALQYFMNALETHSGYPLIWYEVSRTLTALQKYGPAKKYAGKALGYWPENPDLLSILSAIFFKEGDYDKALALSEKAIQSDPQSIMAMEIITRIQREKEQQRIEYHKGF